MFPGISHFERTQPRPSTLKWGHRLAKQERDRDLDPKVDPIPRQCTKSLLDALAYMTELTLATGEHLDSLASTSASEKARQHRLGDIGIRSLILYGYTVEQARSSTCPRVMTRLGRTEPRGQG